MGDITLHDFRTEGAFLVSGRALVDEDDGLPGLRDEDVLGDVRRDGKDQAVYYFDKEKSSKSECYDACAEAWPPVLTEGELSLVYFGGQYSHAVRKRPRAGELLHGSQERIDALRKAADHPPDAVILDLGLPGIDGIDGGAVRDANGNLQPALGRFVPLRPIGELFAHAWARIERGSTVWVSSRIRSASVDLPWSMWAMIEKLRMCAWSAIDRQSLEWPYAQPCRAAAGRKRLAAGR